MKDEANRSLIRVESVQVREHRTVFPYHDMEAVLGKASVRSLSGGNFANLSAVKDPERALGQTWISPLKCASQPPVRGKRTCAVLGTAFYLMYGPMRRTLQREVMPFATLRMAGPCCRCTVRKRVAVLAARRIGGNPESMRGSANGRTRHATRPDQTLRDVLNRMLSLQPELATDASTDGLMNTCDASIFDAIHPASAGSRGCQKLFFCSEWGRAEQCRQQRPPVNRRNWRVRSEILRFRA
jgi:hypothetical protein